MGPTYEDAHLPQDRSVRPRSAAHIPGYIMAKIIRPKREDI